MPTIKLQKNVDGSEGGEGKKQNLAQCRMIYKMFYHYLYLKLISYYNG